MLKLKRHLKFWRLLLPTVFPLTLVTIIPSTKMKMASLLSWLPFTCRQFSTEWNLMLYYLFVNLYVFAPSYIADLLCFHNTSILPFY